MADELVYTSAPRGLRPGSSGFCTVAATEGLSRQVIRALEGLSGYEFHFSLSHPDADRNPVNYAHTHVVLGSETRSVLSRIAFAGADYSGRTNKVAHHVLLGPAERVPGGPAWLLATLDAAHLRREWSDEPRPLPPLPLDAALAGQADPRPQPARHWQQAAGDPGWGGALVRAFIEKPEAPAFVVYEPGTRVLPLLAESLALLPPERRWEVCFATYYSAARGSAQCHWRGVVAGSAAAAEIDRIPNATVVDLTRPLGQPPEDVFTVAARTGRFVERRAVPIVAPSAEPAPAGPSPLGDAAARPRDIAQMSTGGPSSEVVLRAYRRWRRRAAVLGITALALLLTNGLTLLMLATARRQLRNERALVIRPGTDSHAVTSAAPATAARPDTTHRPATGVRPKATTKHAARPTTRTAPPPTPTTAAGPRKPTTAARPPVPPVRRDIALLPEHRLGKQVARERTLPAGETDSAVRFGVGPSTTFVEPPARVRGVLEAQLDGERLRIEQIGRTGINRVRLMTCTLDPGARELRWRPDPTTARRYAASLAHIIVAVFDHESRKVRLCGHPREPATATFGLRYHPSRGLQRLNEEPAVVDYPWPDTLAVRVASLKGGQPIGLDALEQGRLVLNPAQAREELQLTLSLRVDAKAGQFTASLRCADALPTLAADARRVRSEQRSLEREVLELSNDPEKHRKRLAQLRGRINAAAARVDRITHLFVEAAAAFRGVGTVEIVDAWGLPVATLTMPLEVPRPKQP